MHLSCTEIKTITKRIKMSFCLMHVTLEYNKVRPKWFLSLWNVRHKLCTYHASILTLSPNAPKGVSTRPASPRSTIGCVQNNFRAYGMFRANHAPILRQDWHYLQMDQNEVPLDPHHKGEPSATSKMTSDPMYVQRKSCTFLVLRLTLSPNRPKHASVWPLSPRSSIWWRPKWFLSRWYVRCNPCT